MALRIDWNLPTFTKIRRDPAVKRALRASADRVAARCGEGYMVTEGEGATRSRAHVITSTAAARRDNARHSTLARARDAA